MSKIKSSTYGDSFDTDLFSRLADDQISCYDQISLFGKNDIIFLTYGDSFDTYLIC